MEEKVRKIFEDINSLIVECEITQAEWNGKESGGQEDRANEAGDVASYLENAKEEIANALKIYE